MNRLVNNLLLGLAVLLIILFGGLFGASHFVDWNRYRGVFEEEASRITGRDVRVGGRVALTLLPTPSFSLEKIRVSDVEAAGSGEAFFRADALRANLSIVPLLRGVLEANELQLIRPHVHLAFNRTGTAPRPSLDDVSRRLPIAPRDIALQSVKIIDGTLVLGNADQPEQLRVEKIDGDLSAPALEGPYRVRAHFGDVGVRREVRFNTQKPEPDGSLRFKATLKHLGHAATYAVDGRADLLSTGPRVTGDFTAQIPLARSLATAASPAATSDGEPPLEAKATLEATLTKIQLGDLRLTYEPQGKPQIITGDALLVPSRTGSTAQLKLAARWLDLDAIVAATAPTLDTKASVPDGPVAALIAFANRVAVAAPSQGEVTIALDAEQATLAREPVGAFMLKASTKDGVVAIEDMRIGLPGAARADIQGRVTGQGSAATFDGNITLRGRALSRLATWATNGALVLDTERDAPFALSGKVRTAETLFEIREAVGELAGTIVQGDIAYRWKGRRELSILLDGPEIDLTPIFPAPTSNAASATNATNPVVAMLQQSARFGPKAADLDARVKIQTQQLRVPGAVYKDVSADAELRNQVLRINSLRLLGEHGVAIDLEGELAALETRPRGVLRGVMSAASVDGLTALAKLLDWPADWRPSAERAVDLVPLRIAGRIDLGNAGEQPADQRVDVTADGTVDTTRVTLKARFAQGIDAWRNHALDITAILDGPRAEPIAGAFWPRASLPTLPAALSRPKSGEAVAARIAVKSSGIAADKLSTAIQYDSTAGTVAARGQLASASDKPRFDGEIDVRLIDASRVAGWLGGPALPALARSPLAGTARLSTGPAGIKLDRIIARLGPADVAGDLSAKASADRWQVGARLSTSVLDLPTVLQGFGDHTAATGGDQRQAASVWPAYPIPGLDRTDLEGTIELATAKLTINNTLALDAAKAALVVTPRRLEVRNLEGKAAGAQLSGVIKLERPDAAAPALTAQLKLADGDLATLATDAATASPATSGRYAGSLTLASKGVSLRDLVQGLSGQGTLTFTDAKAAILAPDAIATTYDKAMQGPQDDLRDSLRQGVRAAVRQGAPIPIAARPLALTVRDGVLQSAQLPVSAAPAEVAAAFKLDIATFAFDGMWQVQITPPPPTSNAAAAPQSPPGKPSTSLPPITVAARGPLAALARLQPVVDFDAFEREVTVRKLERDVAELERQRKLDEERVRLDAERRRLEAEKAATAATPPDASVKPDDAKPIATMPAATSSASQPALPSAATITIEPPLAVQPTPPPTPKAVPRPVPKPSSFQPSETSTPRDGP